MKEFEISKVLSLAKGNKYAIACAAFDLVDHIFKVEVPKSMRTRKLSVQAMTLLQDGVVKFGYEVKKIDAPVSIAKPVAPEAHKHEEE